MGPVQRDPGDRKKIAPAVNPLSPAVRRQSRQSRHLPCRCAAVRSWNFVSLRLGRRWAVSLWLNEERRKRREIAPCNNSLPTGSLPPPLAVGDSPKCSFRKCLEGTKF